MTNSAELYIQHNYAISQKLKDDNFLKIREISLWKNKKSAIHNVTVKDFTLNSALKKGMDVRLVKVHGKNKLNYYQIFREIMLNS